MIKVFAPASIGNVGVGFDLLGMAIVPVEGKLLGDYVTIEDSDEFNLQNFGDFSNQLPKKLEENIIFQCWKRFCEILQKKCFLTVRLEKNVPVSSGLGSSACSIVAFLVAMNHHVGCPLNNNQILELMGEMESKISGAIHFDNVAPCFSGGMQLIIQECKTISQSIPSFSNWRWVVAYPGTRISTVLSRSILPQEYSQKQCVEYGRFLSGFIHACYTQQENLAIRCMQDIIAEPYRSKLLPVELLDVRQALIKKGALSCGISGAGPTIFVLCNNVQNIINNIVEWLVYYYLQNNSGFVRICSLDEFGTRIVSE